jgi:polyisoprenoid-binding protein YceI
MTTTTAATAASAEARLHDGSLAGEWTLDPARSSVSLQTRTFWGLVPVKGRFGDLSGSGTISPQGEVTGSLRVGAASIDTKNRMRDEHLRSRDLLDSARHPDIVFAADHVTVEGSHASIAGTLEIKGYRRPLTVAGTVTTPDANVIVVDAEVPINRVDYGLGWNRLGMAGTDNTLTVRATFRRS